MDNGKKIEELLEEREKIDQELKERYYRTVTMMFTDLKDATAFVDKRGDIEGRAWIERHKRMIFPIIEDHQGQIIKTNFDEIMASFHSPIEAVEAAIEIQQTLKEHNRNLPLAEQFRIRIGLNTGKALVEKDDIIGDAVNIAKRVESLAIADQILVSEATHEEIRDLFPWKFLGTRPLKGKSEELKIFEIVWKEEKPILRRKTEKGKEVFIIEASLEGKKLIISSYDEEKTLRLYQEKELSIEDLNLQCKEILNLLIQANRSGSSEKGIINRLKEEGERLYNMLFTPKIKERLSSTRADHLILNIADKLVQIPWELCFDGEDFLCRKYNMGRVVRTRQETSNVRYREIVEPLRMIILSNPTGDLKATQKEAAIIQKELTAGQKVLKVDLKCGDVDIAYVQKVLNRYDLVHYAGHADYDPDNPSNSAWILKDGRLKASSILEMVGGNQTLPSFIFSNACRSGQTEQWNVEKGYTMIYGLANAFLLSGVRHYIGTFWEVQDEVSSQYAIGFYKELIKGSTVGEAVRKARMELIDRYPEDNLTWASYMLYGDPTYCYIKAQEEDLELETKDAVKESVITPPIFGEELRARSEEATLDRPLPEIQSRRFRYLITALLLAFLILVFSMLFPTARSYIQTIIQKNKAEIAIKQEDLKKKKAEMDKREWEEIHELAGELDKLKEAQSSKLKAQGSKKDRGR